MSILGPLAGLAASGLYALFDEIRVGHRIRTAEVDTASLYKVNDEKYNDIIRGLENNWRFEGGTLYPEKMIAFFAMNPCARRAWVKMEAGIILHTGGERLSSDRTTLHFCSESIDYAIKFGEAEKEYLANRCEAARQIVEREKKDWARREREEKMIIPLYITGVALLPVSIIIGFCLINAGWLLSVSHSVAIFIIVLWQLIWITPICVARYFESKR